MRFTKTVLLIVLALLTSACDNNPYPASFSDKNIRLSAFSSRLKYLDPARSYSSDEYQFIRQIYEPPLQYHYLKRPYTLIPSSATEVPKPQYFDANGNALPENAPVEKIDHSLYEISIKRGVKYQPHPCFARNDQGQFIYHNLSEQELSTLHELSDFEKTGSRELVANDFVYQIKRLAHPRINSPIYGLMSEYIVGLRELNERLQKVNDEQKPDYLDLENYPLTGVEVVDDYTYRVKIKGKYPQFLYWLAMPFFAPIPPEVDRFYSQKGLIKRNISLNWYPVGTGPYMLTMNNPNYRIILEKNPNFHGEVYPLEGAAGDKELGLLVDAGKPVPFIDSAIYTLEKETIPYWNKFLQGYYDASGISSDNFDQAVAISADGNATLTDDMRDKGIRLITSVRPTIFYFGFNMMLDQVVGGTAESARLLRQAISIAMDMEEFISIFLNERGLPAQSPLPQGIFGHREEDKGINPYVYDWVNGKAKRKPIETARRLLAQAGYPNGRNEKTGEPLVLYLDITGGGADDKSRFDWYRKQFAKLDIQLIVRATDYSRFREKIQKGNFQIFLWGWHADYPDPENFFFLLYGPHSKVKNSGENAANYQNDKFDALFEQMKNMDNGEARLKIIDEMIEILRYDAPWMWGFHPLDFSLYHDWEQNVKPHPIANNGLKYLRIDAKTREEYREKHNQPVLWPLGLILILIIVVIVLAVRLYQQREHRKLEVLTQNN
ncbi:MAG: peptide ABC transporter substrate-binding protein [Candidatus Parabeggiatoa sp. nov. 2]|nr:MAG: peptide ABC transporter substrate-binding protein [Beggiatoa sp. 4572_84]RKZ60569.1 MAG: peptide ABC transporter substrate-binding protein [Gammaproteobacteria bacterium]